MKDANHHSETVGNQNASDDSADEAASSQSTDVSMNQQFEQVCLLSRELQSLIRQGVKDGVAERIQARDQLLRDWFSRVSQQIQLTQQQEAALAELLKVEKGLLAELELEQRQLAERKAGRRKSDQYHKISRTH